MSVSRPDTITAPAPSLADYLDIWIPSKKKTGSIWCRCCGDQLVVFKDRRGEGWSWCDSGRHWSAMPLPTALDAQTDLYRHWTARRAADALLESSR